MNWRDLMAQPEDSPTVWLQECEMIRRVSYSCMLCVALFVLASCGSRCTQYVGDHLVEIIDGHVQSMRSTTTATSDGTPVYTYESSLLRVRLEGEVLTVNGIRYIVPEKDDSICIRRGRVEINGERAKPSDK